jgi:hypothetical protein
MEVSKQIVDAILQNDQEQFNSAFENAIASKISDALEIKKIEIASSLLSVSNNSPVEPNAIVMDQEPQEVAD